jgi:hypothetical protein
VLLLHCREHTAGNVAPTAARRRPCHTPSCCCHAMRRHTYCVRSPCAYVVRVCAPCQRHAFFCGPCPILPGMHACMRARMCIPMHTPALGASTKSDNNKPPPVECVCLHCGNNHVQRACACAHKRTHNTAAPGLRTSVCCTTPDGNTTHHPRVCCLLQQQAHAAPERPPTARARSCLPTPRLQLHTHTRARECIHTHTHTHTQTLGVHGNARTDTLCQSIQSISYLGCMACACACTHTHTHSVGSSSWCNGGHQQRAAARGAAACA